MDVSPVLMDGFLDAPHGGDAVSVGLSYHQGGCGPAWYPVGLGPGGERPGQTVSRARFALSGLPRRGLPPERRDVGAGHGTSPMAGT